MIIRKPYAFLIKYFKIIHIILFFLIGYLSIKTRNIYIFFRDFLKNGTYTYTVNMGSNYINIFMIISTISLFILLTAIYFLMKQKGKKVFYYLSSLIYYLLSFVVLIFFLTVFNNLEFRNYSNQSLVIFRDIAMILYYFNYIFLIVAFIRGFGFNIKKFNFEKDLKDLDITDSDREEIEINSGIDYENISNFFRKRKRNLKYTIKENSFIITFILVSLFSLIGASFLFNKLVTNKTYKETDLIIDNNINYVINYSYITNVDNNSNVIKKNTNYLIVDYSITNHSSMNINPEINNSRLKVGDNYYYPVTNLNNLFADLGNIYKNQIIRINDTKSYILIFEVTDKNRFILELYTGKSVSHGEVSYQYKNILLSPKETKENNLGNYKVNDKIDLSKTYFTKGTLKVLDYQIIDNYDYTYQKCDNNNCVDYKATVIATGFNKLLKIDYEFDLDKDIFNYLNIKYNNNLISSSKLRNITPSNIQNSVFIEVPNSIDSEFDLYFNIRNTKFSISK